MERKLASIQRIDALLPIEGADAIEVACVLGWRLVVKKGDFQVGDMCIYCEVDSVLPERPEFEFLRGRCWVDNSVVKGFRIKTIRLRKQLSQGICFKINEVLTSQLVDTCWRNYITRVGAESALAEAGNLSDYADLAEELKRVEKHGIQLSDTWLSSDVSSILGVVKYDRPLPAYLRGKVNRHSNGNFPGFLQKTDETRIQTLPWILSDYKHKLWYVTEKLDGSSCTFYYLRDENRFGVCSRNIDLEPADETNAFVQMAVKLGIEEKLRACGESIAIQGELIGPGIRTKYGLTENTFFVFNVWLINQQRFLDFGSMMDFVYDTLGLEVVPVLETNWVLPSELSEILELAKGKSALDPNQEREGIVVRPMIEDTATGLGRLSFKVISNDFLEKCED